MIRSSRIPLILDKICTDGISMSLLISKDGELLGSSTTRGSIQQQQHQQSMEESTSNTKINVPSSKNNELPMSNINPSDVAALIAEVIQDYKRLGCELALLDPSFMPSVSSSNNNVSSGSNVDNTAASTSAVAVGSSGNSSTATVSSSIERDGADKKQTGSDEGNLVGKTDTSKIIKENKNEGHRDKGRLNCLIMEMDMVCQESYFNFKIPSIQFVFYFYCIFYFYTIDN